MEDTPFPVVPKALLEALEARWGDRYPEPHLSDRQVQYLGGQVSVVRFLRKHFEEQNEYVPSWQSSEAAPGASGPPAGPGSNREALWAAGGTGGQAAQGGSSG